MAGEREWAIGWPITPARRGSAAMRLEVVVARGEVLGVLARQGRNTGQFTAGVGGGLDRGEPWIADRRRREPGFVRVL